MRLTKKQKAVLSHMARGSTLTQEIKHGMPYRYLLSDTSEGPVYSRTIEPLEREGLIKKRDEFDTPISHVWSERYWVISDAGRAFITATPEDAEGRMVA